MSVIEKYLRIERVPHIWCPGCGNGIILGAFIRALDKLGYHNDEIVVASGIGCSSRANGYLDFDTIHTTHGRALAFATGIKLAKPELKVFVFTGDGDASAIGGNHLIHAARRNIDITMIVVNNNVYGMTGGQHSPMSPIGSRSTTAPYGTLEEPFNIPELAAAAGATFTARGTAYHAKMLSDLIYKGAWNKGFSLIEAVSQCPVSYGRKNKLGSPSNMLKLQKENAVHVKKAAVLPPEELEGKFLIGELHSKEAPEFTEKYQEFLRTMST